MAKAKTEVAESVLIEIPVFPVDLSAYATERADIRCNTARQRYALKTLTESLMRRAARLPPTTSEPAGLLVNSPARALMWVLEQIADESEKAQVGMPQR